MIDCNACRKLIDRDLEAPLDPKDRAAVTNHLRGCHTCVTYRQERLKDSSILKQSVRALQKTAEDTAAPPPPPPPPKRALWPWLVGAAAVVVAAVGILSIANTTPREDGQNGRASTGRGPARTGSGSSRNETDKPVETPHKTATPTGPARGPSVRVEALVVDHRTRAVPGARVALVLTAGPSEACDVATADPEGVVRFDARAAFPVILTAWTRDSVSHPTTVRGPTRAVLTLEPAATLRGNIQVESGLDPQAIQLMASWRGGGRVLADHEPGGAFRVTVPTLTSTEIRPRTFQKGAETFELVPPDPFTVGTRHEGDLTLRGRSARIVVLNLRHPGGGIEQPLLLALVGQTGEPPRFPRTLPRTPGAFHAAVPPGDYRAVVWHRGYREIVHEVAIRQLSVLPPIVLEPSQYTLAGTVRVQPSLDAIEPVMLIHRSPPLFKGAPGIKVPIGPDGRFRAPGLPWQQVMVEVGTNVKKRFGPYALPFQNVELSLDLSGSVEGTVQDRAGTALPGVTVTFEGERGKVHAVAGTAGRYKIEHLPAGGGFLYPRSELSRLELMPGTRAEFAVQITPGLAQVKPLVVPDGRPSTLRLRDQAGAAVVGMVIMRTLKGAPVQAGFPLPAGDTGNLPGVRVPAVAPGDYLAEVIENNVFYLLGKVRLPADLTLDVRRKHPRLTVRPSWRSPLPPPAEPMEIRITREPGVVVGYLNATDAAPHELGGLPAGIYRLDARWGPHAARGLVRLGPPGSPPKTLEIRFR